MTADLATALDALEERAQRARERGRRLGGSDEAGDVLALCKVAKAAAAYLHAERRLEHKTRVTETEHTRTEAWYFTDDGSTYSEDAYQERLNVWEAEGVALDEALAVLREQLSAPQSGASHGIEDSTVANHEQEERDG